MSNAPNKVKPGITPISYKDADKKAPEVKDTKTPHVNEPTEHDIILSRGVQVPVIIDGERLVFEVRPFKFKQLDSIVKATAPFFDLVKEDKIAETRLKALELGKDTSKLLILVSQHQETAKQFICAFVPEVTPELIDEMHPEAVADLIVTALSVNISFFTQRLGPSLTRNLKIVLQDLVPQFLV